MMTRFIASLIACVLIIHPDESTGVLILPGGDRTPPEYTISLYVVCDHYCYENIGRSDKEEFFYDVIYNASKILSQLGVTLEVKRLELWSSYGWTNWTTTSLRPEYFYDVVDRMTSSDKLKLIPYFDDLLFFTGAGLTTGSTSGPSDIRGIHTTGTIGNPSGSRGIITVTKATSLNLLCLTVAHEIGHGLNMLHDTPDCSCPAGASNCIMQSVGSLAILTHMKFSSCSMSRFNTWIAGPNRIALNKNFSPTLAQMGRRNLCGNGNVDVGEECDCGPHCTASGTNACCRNCKFSSGAVCVGGSCCTSTCKFKTSGTKCRNSRGGSCDQDDFCTGSSGECEDKRIVDWTECSDASSKSGYCKSGFCNTNDVQCQMAFSSSYTGAIESCYNASNLPQEVVFKPELSPLCQVLICDKSGSNQVIHADRRSKTFQAGGKQCTVGKYLPVERGVLGLDEGWIKVDDGTKCGLSSACYRGNCLPVDQVKTAMASQGTAQPNEPLCGNGRVDAGEDCDCSPLQCPCCNVASCKFLPSNIPCMGACGVCTGSSEACSESSNPASNFRQCSGSFENLCLSGQCVSALKECQSHYFPWSRSIFQYHFKNIGSSSKYYNSGGYYILDDSDSLVEQSYAAGEFNGECGILHCSLGSPENPPDWDIVQDPKEVFTVEIVNTGWAKVKYYNKANRTSAGRKQRIFHPLLTADGTPCLVNGTLGYCKVHTMTSSSGVTFPRSRCTQI